MRSPPGASGRSDPAEAARIRAALAAKQERERRRNPTPPESGPVRFYFISDSHGSHRLLDHFVKTANHDRPEFVIDGGDVVEKGTQAEFEMAYALRSCMDPKLYSVNGNHDVRRKGVFTKEPAVWPAFQSFDHRGVHVILLDNQDETLTEEQFRQLEADLERNRGKTTVVVLHVPAVLDREPGFVGLRKWLAWLPIHLANPTMRDPRQVERLTAILTRHGVAAVLSGHVHGPEEAVRAGVRYVVSGAAGGKLPGPGIAHEYLAVEVDGRKVTTRRVPLDRQTGGIVDWLHQTLAYVVDVGRFNRTYAGEAVRGIDRFRCDKALEPESILNAPLRHAAHLLDRSRALRGASRAQPVHEASPLSEL